MLNKNNKALLINSNVYLLIFTLFLSDRLWFFNLGVTLLGRQQPYDVIVAGIACILFGAFMVRGNLVRFFKERYSVVIFLIFASVFVSYTFGSSAYFSQPLSRIFRVLFWFSGILVYFYLLTHRYKKEISEKLFNVMIGYGVIAAFFTICASFIPSVAALVSPEVVAERFGLVRFGRIASDSVLLAFCYYSSCLIVGIKLRFRSFCYFLVTGYTIYLVEMSRQKMFTIPICLLIVFLFANTFLRFRLSKIVNTSYIVLMVVILSFVCFEGIFLDFFGQIINSLNMHSTAGENISVSLRYEGISFYYNLLKMTNFVGIGWISTAPGMGENVITHATNVLNLKFADLGVLGTFFQFGPFGIFVYLSFVYLTFKLLFRVYVFGDFNSRIISLALGLFFSIKITSLHYLFFWPAFSFFYALLMFIIDQIYQTTMNHYTINKTL